MEGGAVYKLFDQSKSDIINNFSKQVFMMPFWRKAFCSFFVGFSCLTLCITSTCMPLPCPSESGCNLLEPGSCGRHRRIFPCGRYRRTIWRAGIALQHAITQRYSWVGMVGKRYPCLSCGSAQASGSPQASGTSYQKPESLDDITIKRPPETIRTYSWSARMHKLPLIKWSGPSTC